MHRRCIHDDHESFDGLHHWLVFLMPGQAGNIYIYAGCLLAQTHARLLHVSPVSRVVTAKGST